MAFRSLETECVLHEVTKLQRPGHHFSLESFDGSHQKLEMVVLSEKPDQCMKHLGIEGSWQQKGIKQRFNKLEEALELASRPK